VRRAGAIVALLLPFLAAAPANEASGAAPSHLWYRATVFGTFEETMEGISPSGIIFEQEYAAWQLRSNTATTVSRSRGGLSVGINLKGRIDAYDRSSSSDIRAANTSQRCTQRARSGYWAPAAGPVTGQLSGSVQGILTKPQFGLTAGGEIEVESTTTFTCQDTPGGGSSTTTATSPLPLSGLAPVLLPPRQVFDRGLSSTSRIRFGRFFSVQGTHVITEPLGSLFVGAVGNWVRRWEIEIWFSPCPRLRC
jgi:hypothetical protein